MYFRVEPQDTYWRLCDSSFLSFQVHLWLFPLALHYSYFKLSLRRLQSETISPHPGAVCLSVCRDLNARSAISGH